MNRILLLLSIVWVFISADAQVRRTSEGVTFDVDGELPATEETTKLVSGDMVAKYILGENNVRKEYVTSSFNSDSLYIVGQDVLFQCIVKAYAEHKNLILSPDMVWLCISQGFGHFVNSNSEELRDKLVSHDGRLSLVVESKKDLLSEDVDWQEILNGFVKQIGENSKDDVARTIVADFTTTGSAERISSGITLMDIMKSYFEYVVFRIACGIPSITLTGTPDDWRKVEAKTMALSRYGLNEWTAELKPILEEFVKASEGNPNRQFWKNMVMIDRPDRLRGGACSSEKPTVFDGWFLKLFPYDKDGKHPGEVNRLTKMLPEMVRVDFRYIVIDDNEVKETPMELWAGFVGVENVADASALRPKIGWIVRVGDTDDDVLNDMIKHGSGSTRDNKFIGYESIAPESGISIRVREVPIVLSKLKEIKSLELYFIDRVVLPEWMDNMKIGQLVIHGNMSDEEKGQIMKRFPDAVLIPSR